MSNHNGRDRSEGWTHAKRSGHENEDILRERLLSDTSYQRMFLARIGIHNRGILSITGGGIDESHVPSIFADGRPTTSKTDLYLTLNDNSHINISVKKAPDTQAYLVRPEKFIEAFEKQYGKTISPTVKRAMRLYWGTAVDTKDILAKFSMHKDYEFHKNRLTADTLAKYDITLYDSLLNWFKDNSNFIVNICLSRGGAIRNTDWAQYIWHKNVVDPEYNNSSFDELIRIGDIEEQIQQNHKRTLFSTTRGGGTTIWLPFGFVQWHDPGSKGNPQLQFHLQLDQVHNIIAPHMIH